MNARFSLQTAKMIVGLVTLGVHGSLLQIAFDPTYPPLGSDGEF
jgi:hypothetical protein